jgi:hypothetical protein
MKRTVEVTITKEIEVDIPEILLTEEHIKAFDSYIGLDEASVDDIPAAQEELFKYVARLAAMGYDDAEGMGNMGPDYMKDRVSQPEYFMTVKEIYEDQEMSFV